MNSMNRVQILKWIPLTTLLLSQLASADQCAWVTKDQAKDALKLIDSQKTLYSYCQPCGEDAPQQIRSMSAVIAPQGNSYYSIKLNDGMKSEKEIDLAYTYIKTGKNTLTNVAAMVGCPTQGVDAFVPAKAQ
jgi:hypothetical protein